MWQIWKKKNSSRSWIKLLNRYGKQLILWFHQFCTARCVVLGMRIAILKMRIWRFLKFPFSQISIWRKFLSWRCILDRIWIRNNRNNLKNTIVIKSKLILESIKGRIWAKWWLGPQAHSFQKSIKSKVELNNY
jgi:hypothetical protein